MSRTSYYSPSSRFAPDAPFTALAAGLPAALLLSWVYAYAILYVPIIGIITFALTLGLGIGVGAVTGTVLRARQVRSRWVAWGVGLVAGAGTLYLSWVTWVVGLIRRGDGEASWLGAFFSPAELWAAIVKVNEVGAWSLKGLTPTGGALWVLWAGEALLIVGSVAFMSATLCDEPYCEACGHWCDARKGVATSADGDRGALEQALEQKRFVAIAALGAVTDPAAFLRYDVHECASCGDTNTLTVVEVKVTTKGGKPQSDEREVLRRLLLSRADVAAVDALTVPPPATPPAASAGLRQTA
ncbi:MAG: hypothetical protein IPJ65_12005 [Archangiaceae bacterium]|nr:hypothetical protein [Archangiaceae bacterium]